MEVECLICSNFYNNPGLDLAQGGGGGECMALSFCKAITFFSSFL